MLFGRSRVRADCACGITISAWGAAQLRELYARHLTIPRPPAEVLAKDSPTVADVRLWPDFFISGPGRAVASCTHCPHDYYLTDSCPGCDADAEADRAPADFVTVPFETVLAVFLDGFGTGAASALGKIKPDAAGALIDQAAGALVDRVKVDPLAVEQLREHVRKRLHGEVDNRTTEVRVWGDAT
ncbi:hypothetical protein F5X71_00300 [Nocardia brasiliensis]|uniref:Uncharacterized protein n=1 Tax=Nocardia brasiliensis TaxID=37326 RepID=A0A6G9XJ88_NOCBR|nr:hypothetical protein [Nocardia brasiliensis]QIS00974.1 hypothetical protein F5X71_00300 [Nocardia brasiliensis]